MASIKVSRQGLTRCPACSTHIEVAEVVTQTVCPFCQTELGQALASAGEGGASPLQRLAGSGRSAIIAASMMGMPLVGCADGEDGSTGPVDVMSADSLADVGSDPASDITVDPMSDAMVDPMSDAMVEDDAGPSVADDAATNVAEEPVAVAAYGLPADDTW